MEIPVNFDKNFIKKISLNKKPYPRPNRRAIRRAFCLRRPGYPTLLACRIFPEVQKCWDSQSLAMPTMLWPKFDQKLAIPKWKPGL